MSSGLKAQSSCLIKFSSHSYSFSDKINSIIQYIFMNPDDEKPYVLMQEGRKPVSIRIDKNRTKNIVKDGNYYYSIYREKGNIRFFHIFPLKDDRWDVSELTLFNQGNKLLAANFGTQDLFILDTSSKQIDVTILKPFRTDNLMVALDKEYIGENKAVIIEGYLGKDLKRTSINIKLQDIFLFENYYLTMNKERDQLLRIKIDDNKFLIDILKYFELEGDYYILGDEGRLFRIDEKNNGFGDPRKQLSIIEVSPHVYSELLELNPELEELGYLTDLKLFPSDTKND